MLVGQVFSQKKSVILDDVWKTYSFYAKQIGGIRSLNDGNYFTTLEKTKENGTILVKQSYSDTNYRNTILKFNELLYENKPVDVDDYEFNADETKVLI